MAAFVFTACGDSDGNSDAAACKDAADAFPKRLAGNIYLEYEAMVIEVPIDITVGAHSEDYCELEMITRQDFNPMCGTAFKGPLHYNAEEDVWEGLLQTWDEDSQTYLPDDASTYMDVRYSHRRRDDGVEVWNHMTESPQDLCRDQVIEGRVHPK